MRLLLLLYSLAASSAVRVQDCTASLCPVPSGETWTPNALNISGSLAIVGTPGGPASTLNLSSLSRATWTPGSSIQFQYITLLTDVAVLRSSASAPPPTPSSLIGPGAPFITYTNVTLRLPSSCTLLSQYTNLVCRGAVNSSLVITRWGVFFHSWSSAAVSARNLNVTCGSPLPTSFNLLCTSSSVSQPRELLAALLATTAMAASTTSYIHVLTNISLQGLVPAAAAMCGAAARLLDITTNVIIAGVPTPDNPQPELDWAGWCGIMSVLLPATSVQILNLTLVNLPVGPSVYTPLNLFTSLAFIVAFNREAMGLSGVRLLLHDVTLLLPTDEMVWWRAMAADPSLAVDWATQLPVFLVTEASNGSVSIQHLRSVRGSFVWRNTQLVSVQQRPPLTPLLLHDTGVLRLNGLGPPVFSFSMVRNVPSVIDMFLLPRSWKIPRNRLIVSLTDSGSAYLPNFTTLLNDTVITGYPFQPQAFMLNLAAALTRLSPRGADGQLTLSNLVLGNAAPLLSSLVCGAAARQQGVACTSASLGNTTDPEAGSRAVWRATGLAELGAEGPLPPLSSPALAAALGGLTSLLWFFYTPRSHPLDDQPALATAPLLLLNVTVLLPDLEVQAIREVAASGSTRVNLRPDTLDLMRTQLAGQRVQPAAWPPGGITFPTFSWFGIRGLDVTLAPATPTNPLGQAWIDLWGTALLQLVPSNLTTMVQPDGPLLLTPEPPSPSPDPPLPLPSPGPDPHHGPSPPLQPPSPSHGTHPAASPIPDPTQPSQPPAPSVVPRPTLNSTGVAGVSAACGGVEGIAIGAAAGFAVTCLLVCGVLLLLVARRRWDLSSLTALPGGGGAPAPQVDCAMDCKLAHDEGGYPAAGLVKQGAVQVLQLTAMTCDSHCLSTGPLHSTAGGMSGGDMLCNGHRSTLDAQQQQQQQQQQWATPICRSPPPAIQATLSCRSQLDPNSSSTPNCSTSTICPPHAVHTATATGPAAAVTPGTVRTATMPAAAPGAVSAAAAAAPGAAAAAAAAASGVGPAAGPASWGRPQEVEASTPCLVEVSTGLGQAGLGQAGLEQEVELEQQLGTGAFGTVYRGRWRGMPVAVKRLVFSGLADQTTFAAQRQQVLLEAELNAGLAHPNLVATYAYHFAPIQANSNQGVTDWSLLLVSELCGHGSLADVMKSGRLWDPQLQAPHVNLLLTVLGDVAEGMAYIHSRNIMHRDLKPDNVLLQEGPWGVIAKVADLGLGAVLGRQQTHLSNACAGTPLYMAPEVAHGHASLAGDVYSYGVMAWELLHGCSVWTRLQQITQEPRYLQCLERPPHLFDHDWQPQPACPAEVQPVLKGLRDLVDCCLLPQPSARPSFQELTQWLALLTQLQSRQLQGQ